MKFTWKANAIILGVTALALLLLGVLMHQQGIQMLGNFFLGLTLFSSGAAHIEEKARRKAQSEEVIASQV